MLTAPRNKCSNRLTADHGYWQMGFPSTSPCMIIDEQSEFDGIVGWIPVTGIFHRREEIDRRNAHMRDIAEFLSGFVGSGSAFRVVHEITEESSNQPSDFLNQEYRAFHKRFEGICSNLIAEQGEFTGIERAEVEHAPVQGVADVVREIRERLSLSITELSAILNVRRPTIYAWLRGDAVPQQRNLDRLRELKEIAGVWWDKTVGVYSLTWQQSVPRSYQSSSPRRNRTPRLSLCPNSMLDFS